MFGKEYFTSLSEYNKMCCIGQVLYVGQPPVKLFNSIRTQLHSGFSLTIPCP